MKRLFFRAKLDFAPIETETYVLKLAENSRELAKALSLRYQVFKREFKKSILPIGIDTDRFDAGADHLIVTEKKTSKVVGTYRFMRGPEFFSSENFEISSVLAMPGKKLELGRACIHQDFRNSGVFSLLWAGIIQYAKLYQADMLFGCSSVKTTDVDEVFAALRYLRQKNYVVESTVAPVPRYKINGEPSGKEIDGSQIIPPLLNLYLKMGARVYGSPGIDFELNCADFFTVIKLSEINVKLMNRFSRAI